MTICEFKTYRATPGAADKMRQRFRDTTMPIFSRLGINVVSCWTSDEEPDAFFYLIQFQSEESRKAAWAAFAADPEWKSAKAASETNGPLLSSQTSLLLKPADFSPDRRDTH